MDFIMANPIIKYATYTFIKFCTRRAHVVNIPYYSQQLELCRQSYTFVSHFYTLSTLVFLYALSKREKVY